MLWPLAFVLVTIAIASAGFLLNYIQYHKALREIRRLEKQGNLDEKSDEI